MTIFATMMEKRDRWARGLVDWTGHVRFSVAMRRAWCERADMATAD